MTVSITAFSMAPGKMGVMPVRIRNNNNNVSKMTSCNNISHLKAVALTAS